MSFRQPRPDQICWWHIDLATGFAKRVPRGEVKHALKRDNKVTKKEARSLVVAVEYRQVPLLATPFATFKYGTRAEVTT